MRFLFVALVAVGCGSTPPKSETVRVVDPETEPKRPGAGQLRGVVSDPAVGTPISLAVIELVAADGKTVVDDTISDAVGAYVFRNVEPGSYRLDASHGMLATQSLGVLIVSDETTVINLALSSHRAANPGELKGEHAVEDSGATISGQLLNGVRGDVVAGVTVQLDHDDGRRANSMFTIADDNGRFAFTQLRPGTYIVSVYYNLLNKGNVEIRRSGVIAKKGVVTDLVLELDTESR